MPLTLVESDSFPATLQAPAATEPASAPALVSQFLQGAANRMRWLYNRVNVFVAGGTLTPSASVLVNGAGMEVSGGGLVVSGAGLVANAPIYSHVYTDLQGVVSLSGTTTASNAAGLAVTGAGGLNVTATGYVAGVLTVGSGANVVMSSGTVVAKGYVRAPKRITNGALTAGTNVYAAASFEEVFTAAGSAAAVATVWKIDGTGCQQNETITFTHNGTVAIQIQDPSGSAIGSVAGSSGNKCSQTFFLNGGGGWSLLRQSWVP